MKSTLLAEFIGTALLLAIVIGSGIMGERLAMGNAAITLLANAIATGAGMAVLIALFGPISGAQFNPILTVIAIIKRERPFAAGTAIVAVQTCAAIAGVWLAHLMFDLPILQTSARLRSGIGQWAGECVATFGLVLLVRLGAALRLQAMAAWVALYITAAYWFTSSTSFANPAVTIARSLSDTFAGIHPASVLGFIAAQFLGATLAMAAVAVLTPASARSS
jgi:glycerol uptake facilitator-like aquaporin